LLSRGSGWLILASLWDERKKLLAANRDKTSIACVPLVPSFLLVRIAGSTMETRRGPTRQRSRSKREKDKSRLDIREERKRLFQEAFYDTGYGPHPSIGEVDALAGSKTLAIDRADVLRDPKLRNYVHPSLRG
jgi:hypothetical protein